MVAVFCNAFKDLFYQLAKKTPAKVILLVILLMVITSCTYSRSIQTQDDQVTNPLSWIVEFYRGPLNHLSAVRYGECPMYPSDSEYGLQSIQKHGMLTGWIMAMDRLMRCGRDETRLSPKILINGKWKYFDPVEKNDFWWSDK
jgi:putative component of membrane protein insertase Oxa1/YidC/SpoIIIJ protein YidD